MLTFSAAATLVAFRLLATVLMSNSPAAAIPVASPSDVASSSPATGSSGYWMGNIKRQGSVPFGDASYKVYRNVKDYGAKGDGSSDDTNAINKAITDGNRCGKGCDSSTTTPALVYFPPGEYVVSAPVVQLYYTQLVGDATNLPVIKASASFKGMAVIDSDPYEDNGANWYTNQNNFFRQIRNFVIDIRSMPPSSGAGIHWQVAQATSLQNIRFEMVKGGSNNKQQGIFMDNGSGGFMSDLVFNGGNYGMFLGNQQFTTRNLTFNDCGTAVFMNWNWLWTLKSLSVNNCGVGVNMSNQPTNMTVGSVIIQDSDFINTPKGVITAYSTTKNVPTTGNTFMIDNSRFSGAAVVDISGKTILAGGNITSWAQGHGYTTGSTSGAPESGDSAPCISAPAASATNLQSTLSAAPKPLPLLSSNGKVFERSKPQYESVPVDSFINVKSHGAKGDGRTDDTAAIQNILNSAKPDQVVYFDHGAYLVTSTIKVPSNIRITGECWPLILASGQQFGAQSNPQPVFQVGQPGDKGAVELTDLIFTTKGAQPGAVMIQWNVAQSKQGSAGMWDVHVRIGGFAGTDLQSDKCAAASPSNSATPSAGLSARATGSPAAPAPGSNGLKQECMGAFLLLHLTPSGSLYLENSWYWVADHELDLKDHRQINIFNGRGVLMEPSSGNPSWLYGTSSEHSQLYNYQISSASTIYLSIIQTETPYMQGSTYTSPTALSGGFAPQIQGQSNITWNDPTFATCTTNSCKRAWGLRVVDSSDVLVYGAGLYSFFDEYTQQCLKGDGGCQDAILSIENCGGDDDGKSNGVEVWGLSTVGVRDMVTVDGKGVVQAKMEKNGFASTVVVFEDV